MASAGGQRHHILKPVLHTLKRISIFTLSLTTLQAAAFDNSVSLRLEFSESSDKILLHGERSPLLDNEIQHIYDWGKSPLSSPLNLTQQTSPYSITQWMPKIARQRMNIKDSVDGPNCWNTALHLAKALPAVRFTSAHEFHFWMQSPFCQQIQAKSVADLKPGDIMAIRRQSPEGSGFTESHGFTYVSPSLSFSKGTAYMISAAEMIRTSLVLQTFRLYKKQCYFGRQKDCSSWMDHFRCDFSQLPKQIQSLQKRNSQYAQFKKTLDHISLLVTLQVQGQEVLETHPHPRVPYKVVIEPKTRELFLHSISNIKKSIEYFLAQSQIHQPQIYQPQNHKSPQDLFLWKALWEQSYSLGRQFYCLNRTKNPCDGRMYFPSKSAEELAKIINSKF